MRAKARKIRDLGDEELRQKQAELADQKFHLRLRRSTGQLENPMKLRETKRELARVLTTLGERAREAKAR